MSKSWTDQASHPRTDASSKLTGRAVYGADIALPGMLHAKVLRSNVAHAVIKSVKCDVARKMPGIRAIISRENLPAGISPFHGSYIRDQGFVAMDKVRYVGDVIAAVAADTEAQAAAAVEAIVVDHDRLPAVLSIEEALADGAPQLFEQPPFAISPRYGTGASAELRPSPNICFAFRFQSGAQEVLQRSPLIFEDEFLFSRMAHMHLEPFVSVADANADRVVIWTSHQMPFQLRGDIARMFGLTEHQVTVHVPFVGGAFGAKSGCKTEPLAVALSLLAGRPVRLCYSMEECFLTSTQHAARLRLTTGVDSAGRLLARHADILLDAGAYADVSPLVAEKAAFRSVGPYRFAALDLRCSCVMTNSVPASAFRGFGATQATWASESQIDMIAQRIGLDPYEMRRRNLLRPSEHYVPGESGIDSDLQEGLDLVAAEIGYADRERGSGRMGMGLAIGIKDGGGSNRPAEAIVKITARGSVLVQSGGVEMGQGISNALCTITQQILKAAPGSVRHATIDTDQTPFDHGTIASSGIVVNGTAVARAAEAARAAVLEFAAKAIGCSPGEIDLDNWCIRYRNETIPLTPLVLRAFGGPGFEFTGRGFTKADEVPDAPFLTRCLFWEIGWAAAAVTVDVETGKVVVDKLVISGDAGKAIHHLACKGQDEGGAVMGLGQALFEELRFDQYGFITNLDPLLYDVPRAETAPAAFVSITQEQGGGPGPFGAKGMGEGGMLPIASAIANAIADACGARVTSLPLTPERVLAALDARQAHLKNPPSTSNP
jgi:CO/xanthine dehydrogenase Mo-binding subunit